MNNDPPKKIKDMLENKGMEVYKKGLLKWLDGMIRKEIRKNAKEMNDFYVGRMNAYSEFKEHIENSLGKPKK